MPNMHFNFVYMFNPIEIQKSMTTYDRAWVDLIKRLWSKFTHTFL